MADAIDFSKTQRIVLLIDLSPLLQSQNPNPIYIASILTTSKIILSFASLSSSLFSFKLFFSSLSPLLSVSTLHRLFPNHCSASISFNSPYQTLDSLSDTLNSISSTQLPYSSTNCSHTAGSLLSLAHDYDWASDIENFSGKVDHDLMEIRSNLIILLSPVCRSLKALAEFFYADVNDNCLWNLDDYRAKFRSCFGVVNDAFNSKDIHLCWVGVRSPQEDVGINISEQQNSLIANEIRKFGWGFCWTDSVILGSALVSFGLMYPNIVVSSKLLDTHGLKKVARGQLNLEILDVLGKPLECKCCDVELLHLKVSSKARLDDSCSKDPVANLNTFFGNLNDGSLKLHVTAVRRCTEYEKIEEIALDHFLVQLAECGKKANDYIDNFLADKVLELLAGEKSELFEKHTVPTWQIFLAFLYREGYWALLSLSNSNGDSYTGILKPFTAHSSILSVLHNNQPILKSAGRANLHMVENVVSPSDMDRQKGTSSGRYVDVSDGRRRKMQKHMHQDLTWDSFCNAAYDLLDMDLAEVYLANGFKKSKKLKFLKCWMKEVKNKILSCKNTPDRSCQRHPDPNQQKETDANENLAASYQESDEPLSKHVSSDQSRMQENADFVSCSETSEAFFINLPKKVQHGIESDGVDLKILAERLVSSSIYWLRQKHETMECLEELLLREPKDLKEVHKDNNPSRQPLNPGSTSECLVREYELQIFLRMEILQSEYAGAVKGKLVKQICSLLETIQYLVEGGFHGDISLYDYVERTIKTRYSQKLEEVVKKIYELMDLLPFGEENENPALMLNSEDSDQSWREKPGKAIQDSFSAEDESSHPLENMNRHDEGQDHERKLKEAREKRERAMRFIFCRRQMPDLQRLCVPKPSKAMKTKSVSLFKEPKRKKNRGASYSVVCETPMSGNRSTRGNKDGGGKICNPISKALFQDDK